MSCIFASRYNQATAMCRHYKRPILLIEFDESKSFSLQVRNVNFNNLQLSMEYIITHVHVYIVQHAEYIIYSKWDLKPECGLQVGLTDFTFP